MDRYAKQQIAELLAKAAYALDEQDMPAFTACFDARATFVLQIGEGVASEHDGRDAILQLVRSSQNGPPSSTRHVITNVWYPRTAETSATVVSYLSLIHIEDSNSVLKTTGVYTDEVGKTTIDGGWTIQRRSLQLAGALG